MTWEMAPSGLYVPEDAVPPRRPMAVDLFAGAGGFSCGFHQAGWDVVAAVEFDFDASATYLVNLGGPSTRMHVGPGIKMGRTKTTGWRHELAGDVWPRAGEGWISNEPDVRPVRDFWLCDVHSITGGDILGWLGVERGDLDCVMGGPPCQGFSKAGKRSPHDTRNTLVFQFARLVLEMQPKTMVMENVPGIVDMVTAEGVPVLDALARVLADGGFSTYDALRRSLGAMHGAGGAIRQDTARSASKAEASDAQLDLFSEGADAVRA